ncbi:MAG: efflux transporter periplasmic adaptor subunit, partial [bacterium]
MKRLLLGLPLLLACALLLTSCGGDGEQYEAEIAVPVSVEEVKLRSIEEFIIATGTVNATMEMDLVAEIRGLYRLQTNPTTGRPFMLGDRVTAGSTIVRLAN